MFAAPKSDGTVVGIGTVLIVLVGGSIAVQQLWGRFADSDDSKKSPLISQEQTLADIPIISTEVVRNKMFNNEPVRFLDFRDRESFQKEHIPHSIHLTFESLGSFSPEQNELVVAVFSSKDTRSVEVIQNVLRQKSFEIFLLAGGFEAWKNEGNQVISYGDPSSLLDQSLVTYITQEEIKNSDLNFILLDVQSTENYKKRHIAGALHIPLDQLEKRYREIPSNQNIVVYGEDEVAAFRGVVRLAGLNIVTSKALRGNTHLQPESIFLLEP